MAVWRFPVNLTWNGPGSPGANIWHLRTEAEVFQQTELDAAAAAIDTFYTSLIQGNIFAPGMTIAGQYVTDVQTQEQKEVPFVVGSTGGAGTEAPEVLQICVGWKTSIAARRGRGRTFIGPLAGGVMQSDGSITDSVRTAVTTAANALVSASSGSNGWAVGVYGLQSPGGGPTAPHVLRDFTGATVRDRFAVLRSRRD